MGNRGNLVLRGAADRRIGEEVEMEAARGAAGRTEATDEVRAARDDLVVIWRQSRRCMCIEVEVAIGASGDVCLRGCAW